MNTKEATLPLDENVKMPAAVMRAAARSEEIRQQLVASQEGSQEEDQNSADEATSEGNPELNPESLLSQNDNQSEFQDPPPAAESQSSSEEDWEHKYKSIYGRYVREVEKTKALTERNAEMERILASMQTSLAQAPSSVEVPDLEGIELTEQEANDYGTDFLSVVGKKAKAELAPVLKAAYAKISELEKKLEGVTGVVKMTEKEKLHSVLDEKLPSWRELNTKQEFLDWLGLPDPYSGAIRHNMLSAAYTQGDARRVLAFFNGFLAEEAATAPATGKPDPTETKISKVPLTTLAAPGKAKAAASQSAPAEKPVLTRSQIAAFYADVAAGKYRGRDADKAKAEQMIFQAQREGRIR